MDLNIDMASGKKTKTLSSYVPLWFYKLTRYEYWPFWILFMPSFFYWIILALRARSLAYFTAANPGIELGGFFGESKINILNKIPKQYLPVTTYINKGSSYEEVKKLLDQSGLTYPIICKPDKGEMGFNVEKIIDEKALRTYLLNAQDNFIVQEFIGYETELGILFYRFPDGKCGITSIVQKEFLSVTGDGLSSIRELIQQSVRARFQLPALQKKLGEEMETILATGQKRILEPIGNHCKGTRFLNGCALITPGLIEIFNQIACQMDGFYFGRFDLKVRSLEDLYRGEYIRIMEVNGTTSEPAHIYGPDMNLWKVYRAIFQNMQLVNAIAIANHRKGVPYTSLSEVLTAARLHFKMKKKHVH